MFIFYRKIDIFLWPQILSNLLDAGFTRKSPWAATDAPLRPYRNGSSVRTLNPAFPEWRSSRSKIRTCFESNPTATRNLFFPLCLLKLSPFSENNVLYPVWKDWAFCMGVGWVEINPSNIRKHPYLTSVSCFSIVPWGEKYGCPYKTNGC